MSNPESSDNPNPSDNSSQMELPIEFLTELIPKEFSGNRFELGQFIANCNNADSLATDRQKIPLLYFILSKISGHAKEQLTFQKFNTWSELKEQLKRLYQDKKHCCQVMEELNSCKQSQSESISSFYQRLQKLSSRALSAIQQCSNDPLEIPGKKKAVEEITLNRFMYHSSSQISQMLRWKDFDNLNSAYTAAVSEERALNIHKYQKQKSCNICGKTNHDTSQCRFKSSNPDQSRVVNNIQTPNQSHTNDNQQRHYQPPIQQHQYQHPRQSQGQGPSHQSTHSYQNKICKYCKKPGHLISECRKRLYVNSQREQQFNSAHNMQPLI